MLKQKQARTKAAFDVYSQQSHLIFQDANAKEETATSNSTSIASKCLNKNFVWQRSLRKALLFHFHFWDRKVMIPLRQEYHQLLFNLLTLTTPRPFSANPFFVQLNSKLYCYMGLTHPRFRIYFDFLGIQLTHLSSMLSFF